MAGSLNLVQIIGNLGKDPEVRSFQNGGKVCNLSIATSESWKDKQTGERKERTEWHRVTIFNEALAGIAEQYLRKGSKVYIAGQLETRKYQDKDGSDRYTTEIVLRQFNGTLTLLGDPPGGGQGGGRRDDDDRGGGGGGQTRGPARAPAGGRRPLDDLDDDLGDIPFRSDESEKIRWMVKPAAYAVLKNLAANFIGTLRWATACFRTARFATAPS